MRAVKHATYARHLMAYAWAAPFCFEKEVTDLGCGEGFGLQLLSWFAIRVRGVDISPTFMRRAVKRIYGCVAWFDRVDADEDLYIAKGDVVVAFEFLEHIKDPKKVVRYCAENENTLIFSVPHCYPHPLHLTDFTSLSEVEALGLQQFAEVEYYQMDAQGLIQPGCPLKAPPPVKGDSRSLYRYLVVCKPRSLGGS